MRWLIVWSLKPYSINFFALNEGHLIAWVRGGFKTEWLHQNKQQTQNRLACFFGSYNQQLFWSITKSTDLNANYNSKAFWSAYERERTEIAKPAIHNNYGIPRCYLQQWLERSGAEALTSGWSAVFAQKTVYLACGIPAGFSALAFGRTGDVQLSSIVAATVTLTNNYSQRHQADNNHILADVHLKRLRILNWFCCWCRGSFYCRCSHYW